MKKVKKPAAVVNRRAHYDYNLSDKIEVGMVLTGAQVRLIRDRHAQLKGTYVTIRNHELWLLGLTLGSDTAENIKRDFSQNNDGSDNNTTDGSSAGE